MRNFDPGLCAFVASILALSAGAASDPASAPLRIAGSTTLFPIAEGWVAGFRDRWPAAAVELRAGGTTAGLAAVIDGSADLALASRPLRQEEQVAAAERGIQLERFEVARDALAVFVHGGNPVEALTLDQARAIFTGEVRDWQDVGGPASPVTVVARNPSSYSGQFFRQQLLQGRPFAPGGVQVANRADMVALVSTEPSAVGFAGLADIANSERRKAVKPVKLIFDDDDRSTYAISRPLFFFARAPLSSPAERFVRFVLSPEGQELILASNFFPAERPAIDPEAGKNE